MTSVERMYALRDAVRYVVEAKVPGAVVECGVWRGGSSMLAALALLELDADDRELYLYDTFEGMPEPSSRDASAAWPDAHAEWAKGQVADDNFRCVAALDEVRANMTSTGYPDERITYVPGRVEDTIPATAPAEIAILRLDTDWYESTHHELVHLYPRLSPGGVLILDDYGFWQGARQATDEYFGEHGPVMLTRVDDTGRVAIKRR